MPRNNWSREELILAFNLYCKIPFSKTVKTNPKIIELAEIIGRTPSAVAMKLGNFGRLDPELKKRGIKGLSSGSKSEEEIWNEFHNNWDYLAEESEILLSKNDKSGGLSEFSLDSVEDFGKGLEKETIVKTRLNQSFFRASVLSSYNCRCAITGIAETSLLIASHIIPWSKDDGNRLNPRNGICLNSLHDKAFDRGLITVTPDFKLKISKKISEFGEQKWVEYYFLNYENREIFLPHKFTPDKNFLIFHNEQIFI